MRMPSSYQSGVAKLLFRMRRLPQFEGAEAAVELEPLEPANKLLRPHQSQIRRLISGKTASNQAQAICLKG